MSVMTERIEVVYLQVPASLKRRLKRLAKDARRKITAEGILALEQYVEREEKKRGLGPLPEEPEDD